MSLLVLAFAWPTNAARFSLSDLALKINKLAAKLKNVSADGMLPAKFVAHSNKISGLQSKTAQSAIDEISLSLSDLVRGVDVSTLEAQAVRKKDVGEKTTWTATTYGVCTNVLKSATATVTFTPSTTDDTSGTWSSTPYNIFNPGGSGAGLCLLATRPLPRFAVTPLS